MIDQIRPTELADWFARNPNARPVVLDVREPWELQTASVAPQGFTLATIPMNEIPARVSELDPGQRIACLCHHGARSQRVAAFLAQSGQMVTDWFPTDSALCRSAISLVRSAPLERVTSRDRSL